MTQGRGQQTSVKSQTVNILGFADHLVSVLTTQPAFVG